jgi:hypothetical protein
MPDSVELTILPAFAIAPCVLELPRISTKDVSPPPKGAGESSLILASHPSGHHVVLRRLCGLEFVAGRNADF